MIAKGISETVSEKRRRGRPRCVAREFVDRLPGGLTPHGCQRTKTNHGYRARTLSPALRILSSEDQRTLFGCAADDIRRGTGQFPRGWDTAAEEIGRFLVSIDADDDIEAEYLRVVVQARRDGIGWRRIRSHFRALRLGERCGDVQPLVLELARTVDAYRSRFPATPPEVLVAAARRLIVALSDDCDTETAGAG